MFVCKICGNEVKQGQAFCQTCGADVVDNYETVCPVCNSKNGAGSRYCARCGGILQVMRKPVCVVCGAQNLPGAKYCVSCGAPIELNAETHSDFDMLDARKAKQRLDNMERDRMAAVDKEIAEKRAKAAEEKEKAIKEVDEYRKRCELEYREKAGTLEAYRERLNELGSEDVELLKKISVALKEYSKYYADPYSQIDEDDIETDTYVCPSCGTINPLNATACTNCGRSKARSLLLLAKEKIVQHPPIKRKQRIIAPPDEDLEKQKTPTLEEFAAEGQKQEVAADEIKEETQKTAGQEAPGDFSGPGHMGYPYPPYPYAAYGAPYGPAQGGYYYAPNDPHRQMPPIVQPVAFVPYVTQEQPLMQYLPEDAALNMKYAEAVQAKRPETAMQPQNTKKI